MQSFLPLTSGRSSGLRQGFGRRAVSYDVPFGTGGERSHGLLILSILSSSGRSSGLRQGFGRRAVGYDVRFGTGGERSHGLLFLLILRSQGVVQPVGRSSQSEV